MSRIVESLYEKYNLNEDIDDLAKFRTILYNYLYSAFMMAHNKQATSKDVSFNAKCIVDTFDILLNHIQSLEQRISELEN